MSFTSSAATLATVQPLSLRELPMPAWVFGVIAFASFVLLLAVLWSFRNTSSKYERPTGFHQGGPHGSQRSPGATDGGVHH